MSNANLIVSGSIYQGDCRFSNMSRARQCALMSLSALFICANGCRVLQWTTDTIDQILIEGDAIYLEVLENRPNHSRCSDIVTDLFTRSSLFVYDGSRSNQNGSTVQ